MRQGLARALGGIAVLAVVAGMAACNSTSNDGGGTAGGGKCGYKIDFFGALTGSAANLGVNIEQGAELAIDEYNEKNGKDCITIVKTDSQGSPDAAPGLARTLVTDKKVLGVVGPAFSGESQAADPIFEQAGLPIITPSATDNALSTNGWKTFHRAVANNSVQGKAAGAYIADVLKAQKVFVADDQSAYGAGLAKDVKDKLGSAVVGTDQTSADGKQSDFSGLVQAVVNSGATAMFYGGYYTNGGLIRKQLTAAGWKGTLVGGDGMRDPGLAETAGNAAVAGSIVTCPCAPPDKAAGDFAAKYKAKWGVEAGTYSDVAYDAANMFLKGIDEGNTTIEKMNAYLSTVTYTGAANTYKFTSTGELDPQYLKVWAYKFGTDGSIQPDQEINQS